MITTIRLTREQVQAKYAPVPDLLWTLEIEARFFAGLPKAAYRHTTKPDALRALLIRDFGKVTLKAKRLSAAYISTLGAILGDFAETDTIGNECLISQRDEHLGTARAIRTIQAQMLQADLLVKETRPQGHGFVGEVFVYASRPLYCHRKATWELLETTHRRAEGEYPYPAFPSNLQEVDVMF